MLKNTKETLKELNILAIPIVTTFIIEIIFQMCDKAIIGRTSIEAFAGVSVAANIIFILTGTVGILSVAFGIMFARAYSKNNLTEYTNIFNTSMTFCILIGIIFEIVVILFGKDVLQLFFNLNGQTLEYSCEYLYINAMTLGLNMVIFIFSTYFKNLKNTKLFMYSTSITLLVNFFLDYSLVFGKFGLPKLGVKGAAIGSVVGLLAGIFIFVLGYLKLSDIKFKFKIHRNIFKDLLKLYIPLLFQDFIESTLFIIVLISFVSSIGVNQMATYTLIETIISFVFLPVYAYSGASATLTTLSFEKEEYKKAKNYAAIASRICFIYLILVSSIIAIFPKFLPTIITNDKSLIITSSSILILAVVIQVFNILNQIYKSTLQGIQRERWVLHYSTFCTVIFIIVLYIFIFILKLNLFGVYLGLGLYYLTLGTGYKLKQRNVIQSKMNLFNLLDL